MVVRIVHLFVVVFSLSGCFSNVVKDSGPSGPIDLSGIADAVPQDEPLSRGGNPSSYVVFGKHYYVLDSAEDFKERGVASWYGNKFHGNKTSNGEIYDMYAMSAAHKRLPLPSYVRVTNLNNNRSVIVRVNDRGPFHEGRIIDLSYVAAYKLGIDKVGTAPVEVVALRVGSNIPTRTAERHDESIAVQVGAFSIRTSAERVRKELSRQFNIAVGISEVLSQGKKFFRVRLGPFNNLNSARDWIRKLDKLSYGQASLVYLD
ncbi:MAG: septal ring lytic transglycosylase RlpA family protein [Gammaproteobacteria bacterium]|nr:septal ring lytic transglycosylase RlpA family protein [Gammaproteobacteria bacterium]